jgi:hypothetical protein
MAATYPFSEERFILCEGDDDKFFLEALIEERHLPRFQVRHTAESSGVRGSGGTSGFLNSLNGIDALTGFDKLKGILLVTDNDKIPKSFNDMRRILKALKLTPPNTPTDILDICGKPGALLMIPSQR